jgi:hypothetical protein
VFGRVCAADTDVARLERFELLLCAELVGHGCDAWTVWRWVTGGVGRIRGGSSADAELGKLRCGGLGGPENRLTTFGWELTQILSEPQLSLLLANVAPLLESCTWDNTVSPRLCTQA